MSASLPNRFAAALRPRWLQGMVWPTLLLWLYAFALSLVSVWHPEGALPPGADLASRAAFFLILSFWVTADARKRRLPSATITTRSSSSSGPWWCRSISSAPAAGARS